MSTATPLAENLRLFVYVLGLGTNSFSIIIENSKTVDELKKAILKEIPNALEGIDPNQLTLYKVNLPDGRNLEHLASQVLQDEPEELSVPSCELSEVFPVRPQAKTVSILLDIKDTTSRRLSKRPRLDNSPPHTPAKMQAGMMEANESPPRLTREETVTNMAIALEGFQEYIKDLAAGNLDGYLNSIQAVDKVSCPGVVLPSDPILLIHDLGKHIDQRRISQLFTGGTVHLFNVSGSGKTRLALDGLCSHWGLYITCKNKAGPASGSNDFAEATKMLETMSTWGKGTSTQDISNNVSAAQRILAMLFCARFFILEQLVQHLPINTDVTVARRRWVLAQVLPPCLMFHNDDLFVKVLLNLRYADTDVMLGITRSLQVAMTKRKDLFPEEANTPLFLVIDEAQVAADNLKDFFRSGSGTDLRPILREMVSFFKTSFKGIILSGTGLSVEKVKKAVGSSSAKRSNETGLRVFTDVGCFTRGDPSQVAYIRRYLTLSNDNISDKRLLERMVYWFHGRYRLTASLIELFLHSENIPHHRVLTKFAEHLTGFKITDAIELEAGEPPLSLELSSEIERYQPLTELGRLFEEPKLPNREELIGCLVDVLMRWTLTSELTSVPIERNMHQTIALGVGFLDRTRRPSIAMFEPDVTYPVYISEPLVVVTLSSLFEQHNWTTKKTSMVRSFRNAPNSSSLGFVLETGLLLVLMEIFGGKFTPLADAFHCNTSLGSRRASLVSLKRTADGVMQSCPVSWKAGSSDRLGLKARSPADVLTFLDNPDGKAFLFPDAHMGPDLLCFLQDEETKELILLAMQAKVSPTLNATTWQKALISVTPQFFYTMVVADSGRRVQYAPVSYPGLIDDLTRILGTVLGPNVQVPIETYRSKLRSSTQGSQQTTLRRQTPRFLRVIATPDDRNQKKKSLKEEDAVLRWDKMQEYFGSTVDLVKNTAWLAL